MESISEKYLERKRAVLVAAEFDMSSISERTQLHILFLERKSIARIILDKTYNDLSSENVLWEYFDYYNGQIKLYLGL